MLNLKLSMICKEWKKSNDLNNGPGLQGYPQRGQGGAVALLLSFFWVNYHNNFLIQIITNLFFTKIFIL